MTELAAETRGDAFGYLPHVSPVLRVLAALLALVLLVLVGMNFLVVSNLRDEVAALRAQVEHVKAPPGPASAAEASFEWRRRPSARRGRRPAGRPLGPGAPVKKAWWPSPRSWARTGRGRRLRPPPWC